MRTVFFIINQLGEFYAGHDGSFLPIFTKDPRVNHPMEFKSFENATKRLIELLQNHASMNDYYRVVDFVAKQ